MVEEAVAASPSKPCGECRRCRIRAMRQKVVCRRYGKVWDEWGSKVGIRPLFIFWEFRRKESNSKHEWLPDPGEEARDGFFGMPAGRNLPEMSVSWPAVNCYLERDP
ncbi:MAG: hypothetical protein D6820_01105 [Lentisphaerae bacterium]|nr:MAG: hypothetical protein D6820_01105 [Lentisphaerota bacterium]